MSKRILSAATTRRYATTTGTSPLATSSALNVFDPKTKLLQRNRAAKNVEFSRLTDYLRDEVAAVMVDRLLDIKRRFPAVLDLYSGPGYIAKQLEPQITQRCLMADSSWDMLYRDADEELDVQVERVLMEEHEVLPFPEESQDCIMSSMALHWVNDLPGVMIQARRTLRPDGVFLCSLLGGDTLFELRTSLQLASLERSGGISPRISPMTDSVSISNIISRAGFALPTVDVDEIKINYPSMIELVEDLRGMGDGNAVWHRPTSLPRDQILAAAAIYQEMHGNPDGSIPATFQIIYGIGWKPHPSQPKPAKRGSGQVSLQDALSSFPERKKG